MDTTRTASSIDDHAVPLIEKPACLPAANQNQSSFMRLPAEIRLIILRELLVAREPIDKRTRTGEQAGPNGKYKDKRGRFTRKYENFYFSYGLCPTILSTCQSLLSEGWSLMYHENILVLNMHAGWTGEHESRIFMHGCTGCVASGALQDKLASSLDFTVSQARSSWPLSQTYFLDRFQQFLINLAPNAGTFLGPPIRGLAQIMQRKSMEVRTSFTQGTPDAYKRWQLKSFQLMRCKKFALVPMAGFEDVVQETKKIVESNDKVVELELLMPPLNRCLKMVQIGYNAETYREMEQIYAKMSYYAKEFDVQQFLLRRKKFMKLFRKACKNMTRQVFEDDETVLALVTDDTKVAD